MENSVTVRICPLRGEFSTVQVASTGGYIEVTDQEWQRLQELPLK